MRAALALGMSRSQAIRTIILPQALIRMLPSARLAARHRDQGQRHRLGRRRAGADAPVADPGRQDLPAVRDLHRRDAGLLLPLLSRGARRRRASTGASPIWARRDLRLVGRLGNLGRCSCGAPWSRWRSPCVTMALAIPGGLLLAALRLSPFAPVRGLATAFVEFFRATPLILQIYWVFYVLPAFFDVRLSAAGPRRSSAWPATSPPSTPRPSAPASARSARASGTRAWRSA